MKKDLTEIVFVIDKSGSMSGLEKDTIGGFNSLLRKQKKLDGECLISLVFFDDCSEVVYDRVPIDEIDELTEEQYVPSGCTALIDALGDSIKHIGNVHKYARQEDVPENTLFVITTDGLENCSHKYRSDYVKKLVERQKEKFGWEFIFVAANIDAVENARNYGIDSQNAVNYVHDNIGTAKVYESVECAVHSVRMSKKLNDSWSDCVKKDYDKRNK